MEKGLRTALVEPFCNYFGLKGLLDDIVAIKTLSRWHNQGVEFYSVAEFVEFLQERWFPSGEPKERKGDIMGCLTPKQLQQLRDDITSGVSMIVEKEHYYRLEAQANSQPALLAACEAIKELACIDQGGPTTPTKQDYRSATISIAMKAKAAIEAARKKV